MYCPLCQAEYREGFAECSDCRVKLVASAAQARSAAAQLWKGASQRALDKVLAALDAQGIASRFKEIVNARPQLTILGIPIGAVRSTFEYEVWVFRSDHENARRVIQNAR
jgi:hypothetical protein